MTLRKFYIPLLLVSSLSLGACAGGVPVFSGEASLTAEINNPVGQVDIYRVKNVYAATLGIANTWREFCWSKPYAVLMSDPVSKPTCQRRRTVVRTLQAADDKAYAAITTAENFTRNNPTISAASAVGAAWTAVSDFQSLAARSAIVP